jgi:hypothetical protein
MPRFEGAGAAGPPKRTDLLNQQAAPAPMSLSLPIINYYRVSGTSIPRIQYTLKITSSVFSLICSCYVCMRLVSLARGSGGGGGGSDLSCTPHPSQPLPPSLLCPLRLASTEPGQHLEAGRDVPPHQERGRGGPTLHLPHALLHVSGFPLLETPLFLSLNGLAIKYTSPHEAVHASDQGFLMRCYFVYPFSAEKKNFCRPPYPYSPFSFPLSPSQPGARGPAAPQGVLPAGPPLPHLLRRRATCHDRARALKALYQCTTRPGRGAVPTAPRETAVVRGGPGGAGRQPRDPRRGDESDHGVRLGGPAAAACRRGGDRGCGRRHCRGPAYSGTGEGRDSSYNFVSSSITHFSALYLKSHLKSVL